jgi:hypothetical protein
VIEFFEMAQFVDNYIILKFSGKIQNFVIKIEIAFAARTAPAGFLVLYADPIVEKIVMPVKKFHLAPDEMKRRYFARRIPRGLFLFLAGEPLEIYVF